VKKLSILLLLSISSLLFAQENLRLNDKEYFHRQGLDITFFSDYYPEGHQSGVTIIQHGVRVAANGDLRLEPSPGQWSPVPKWGARIVDLENQSITQELWYPDSSKNRKGFNPVIYPDLNFFYQIEIKAEENGSITVTVDLDEPLPDEWCERAGFNLELFPGDLFGKTYQMDNTTGIFMDQPVGPLKNYDGELLTGPLASGKSLVIAPEENLWNCGMEEPTTTTAGISSVLVLPNISIIKDGQSWFLLNSSNMP
jgi:endoglucanase